MGQLLATMLVIVSHGESHGMVLGLARKVINLQMRSTLRRLVLANTSPVLVIEIRRAYEPGGVDLDLRSRLVREHTVLARSATSKCFCSYRERDNCPDFFMVVT